MSELVGAVVAYNGGELLAQAVGDLVALCGADNVLVVDNGSTDDSTAKLPAKILRQADNIGYAGGTNLALNWAAEKNAVGLFLLNQDARIDKDGGRLMWSLLAGDANLGAVFAKVVQHDRAYLLDGLAGRRNFRHFLTTDLGAGNIDPKNQRAPLPVQHGHGAALMLRVNAARQVGSFDESLFAYHDEVDLCWRLAKAHWGVVLEPRAVVSHLGPQSQPRRRLKTYLLARNSLLVARKNAGWLGWLRVVLWVVAAGLLYYGPTALAGDQNSRAAIKGWLDGIVGRKINPAFLSVLKKESN